MNCKRFFIASALISLMSFLPSVSFSESIHEDNINGNFYISAKYMPSASHFGVFSVKEEKNTTTGVFGLKQDWDGATIKDASSSHTIDPSTIFSISNYSFKYENNPFLGFAGAIGYSMGGPRVEFEVSYEIFDVKNQGNSYKNDAHKYCALSRHTGGMPQAGHQNKFVFLKNEGLLDISLMINACYDITIDSMPFSPYICAGIGSDLVSMFETTNPKISYQGKLGVSYSISPEASVFVGGHFHRVIGNEFKDIPAITPAGATEIKGTQFTTVTLNICHFGLELGGRFTF
ncbi:P44/Msp2 family outer membrane protein [Ehrlichia canis]|uniref:Surface antigen msp4 n=2 Tax=Ehrlichia canis TaxID=944 RepID=A0ACA6AWN4_EHRCJ|nr:P44/Msp2 family outer membrane protein [Ehrlichia canis]AAC68667.1 major outer membrane protein P30 [Ehrlichia canis]AAG14362.1 p28-8 [Ehrlichia canis]AAZ68948.1 Surface antigen msp4 [Ehrlichia canis str. Jake]